MKNIVPVLFFLISINVCSQKEYKIYWGKAENSLIIKALRMFIILLFVGINQMNAQIEIQSGDSSTNPLPEIVGVWVSEDDPSYKISFNSHGVYLELVNNVQVTRNTYSISHSCGGENDSKFYFLKLVDEDGDIYCFEINGVNANNSGILSLTYMDNGKIFLYNKQ